VVEAAAVALLAGISIEHYLSLPSWLQGYYNLVVERYLNVRRQQKESEIQAVGVAVGNAVGRLFKA
jgi:hypothetical protein